MPEAQLTEPLDHAAEKGGVKELFAALDAAVKADVDAFLRRGDANPRTSRPSCRPFTVEPSPRRAKPSR